MFFLNLPLDVIRYILSFLSKTQLGGLTQVSKRLQKLSDEDFQWQDLLEPQHKVNAKKNFLSSPQMRLLMIGFGKNGKEYINKLIADKVATAELTEVQRQHLNSELVREQIMRGALTIDAAIENSKPKNVVGLTIMQLQGVKLGLTPRQVKPANFFTSLHVEVMTAKKFTYQQIKFLTDVQIAGMLFGLSREQVLYQSWFSASHLRMLQEGKLTYEEIKGVEFWKLDELWRRKNPLPPQIAGAVPELNSEQRMGIEIGLTPAQVSHAWFTSKHAVCIEIKKFTYEQIQGLNPIQIEGMEVGLTRVQVEHKWFSLEHAFCIAKGEFTYAQIEGLNSTQIEGMRSGLTRGQVNHSWFTYMHLKCIRSERFSYLSVFEKSARELEAKCLGLTVDQMRAPWFTPTHAEAIDAKTLTYEQIAGLSALQVEGLQVGYTRAAVTAAWFSEWHVQFVQQGVATCDEIKELNAAQIVGVVCCELNKSQVKKPWFTLQVAMDIFALKESYEAINKRKEMEEYRDEKSLLLVRYGHQLPDPALASAKIVQDVSIFAPLAIAEKREETRSVCRVM